MKPFIVLSIILIGIVGYLLLLVIESGSGYAYESLIGNDPKGLMVTSEIEVTQNTNNNEKIIFGKSNLGKGIEGYIFGEGEFTMMLIAGLHGNEKSGSLLLQRLVEEIQHNNLLLSKKSKVIIIPITNPDGYYDRSDKLNSNGVNLNRNFATKKWVERGYQNTYTGKTPFSEVESQLLSDIIDKYNPDMLLSYHAQGAFTTNEAGDTIGAKLAQWYADQSNYAYDGNDGVWDFEGTASKWFFESTGKPEITIELTNYLDDDWELHKIPFTKILQMNQEFISILE